MSYCRFSDGDVYLFHHVDGFIECCACRLAKLVPTIFTKGFVELFKTCPDCGGDGCEKCWCRHCQGEGCGHCMMPDNSRFDTRTVTLAHLQTHRDSGHEVPEYAFQALRDELRTKGDVLQ